MKAGNSYGATYDHNHNNIHINHYTQSQPYHPGYKNPNGYHMVNRSSGYYLNESNGYPSPSNHQIYHQQSQQSQHPHPQLFNHTNTNMNTNSAPFIMNYPAQYQFDNFNGGVPLPGQGPVSGGYRQDNLQGVYKQDNDNMQRPGPGQGPGQGQGYHYHQVHNTNPRNISDHTITTTSFNPPTANPLGQFKNHQKSPQSPQSPHSSPQEGQSRFQSFFSKSIFGPSSFFSQ